MSVLFRAYSNETGKDMKVYCYYFDGEKREDNVECVINRGKSWRKLRLSFVGDVWIGDINCLGNGYYYSLKELTRREIKILDNCWK